MMMMISSSTNNQLELDSISVDQLKPHRTNSVGSTSSSSDDIPEMIMSSSLTSFSTDNDSLSSSIRSNVLSESPRSPRSIFQNYWTSPTHTKSLVPNKDEEEELIARLSTLQIPFDDTNTAQTSSKIVHEAPPSKNCSIEQKASSDDASVDYAHAIPSRSPSQTKRRQILPTPPPATAISSSLMMPRRPLPVPPLLEDSSSGGAPSSRYGRKRSNSTSVLLVKPSILRKSRYSCSAIVTGRDAHKLHHGLRNEGCHDLRRSTSAAAAAPSSATAATATRPTSRKEEVDALKKSVSFYSQVSVFEFQVPPEQQKSQKGWSKYFV